MSLISWQHYHQMFLKESDAVFLSVLTRIQPGQMRDSFAIVATVHANPQQTWDIFKRVGLKHT